MTSEIDLAIPGSIKTPPTVGMTTIDLLNHGDPEGALLECADGVEGGRISLLRHECESKDGSDKERKLCAVHVTALPGEKRIIARKWQVRLDPLAGDPQLTVPRPSAKQTRRL
jgi:hypothetical protein